MDGGKHSNKDLSTDDISDADCSSFFVDDGDSKRRRLSACSSPFACSDTDDSLNAGSKSDGGKHSKNKDLSTDDISDADRSSFFVDDGDSKA